MVGHGKKTLAALCFAHDLDRAGEKLPAPCGNGFRVGGIILPRALHAHPFELCGLHRVLVTVRHTETLRHHGGQLCGQRRDIHILAHADIRHLAEAGCSDGKRQQNRNELVGVEALAVPYGDSGALDGALKRAHRIEMRHPYRAAGLLVYEPELIHRSGLLSKKRRHRSRSTAPGSRGREEPCVPARTHGGNGACLRPYKDDPTAALR